MNGGFCFRTSLNREFQESICSSPECLHNNSMVEGNLRRLMFQIRPCMHMCCEKCLEHILKPDRLKRMPALEMKKPGTYHSFHAVCPLCAPTISQVVATPFPLAPIVSLPRIVTTFGYRAVYSESFFDIYNRWFIRLLSCVWHASLIVTGCEETHDFNFGRSELVSHYGNNHIIVSHFDAFKCSYESVRDHVLKSVECWSFLHDEKSAWPTQFLEKNDSYYRRHMLTREFRAAWHGLIDNQEELAAKIRESSSFQLLETSSRTSFLSQCVSPFVGLYMARMV